MAFLSGLGVEYTRRRNYFIDGLLDKFHLELASTPQTLFPGSVRYIASDRSGYFNEKGSRKPLFSFVPPSSGMFVWVSQSLKQVCILACICSDRARQLQFHFEDHPKFKELGEETLEMQLWIKLAEGGLLIGPGMTTLLLSSFNLTPRKGICLPQTNLPALPVIRVISESASATQRYTSIRLESISVTDSGDPGQRFNESNRYLRESRQEIP